MIWGNSNNGAWRLGIEFVVTQETDAYVDIRAELWIWTKYATWEATNSLTVGTISGSWSYHGSTYGFSLKTNRAWSENNRARIWDGTRRFDKSTAGYNVDISASLTGVNYPNSRYRESVYGSTWVPAKPISRPDTPRDLVATWVNDSTISLRWSNTNPNDQRKPYRNISVTVIDQNEGNWYEADRIPVSESYTWSRARQDSSYVFAVRPSNEASDGDATYSNTVKTRPSAPGQPIVTANAAQQNGTDPNSIKVSLSWGYPSGKTLVPSSYIVYCEGQTSGEKRVTQQSATIDNLKAGSNYTFRVSAVSVGDGNDELVGPKSYPTTMKTISPPYAQTLLTIDDVSVTGISEPRTSTVKLSWQAINGASEYAIFGGPSIVKTPDTTAYVDGLIPGSNYSFYVVAINAVGSGPKSNYVSVKAPNVPEHLIITDFTPIANGVRIGVMSGGSNGSYIDKYEYRILDGTSVVTAWSKMLVTKFDAPLPTGKDYTLEVRASNAVGTGPISTAKTSDSGGHVFVMSQSGLVKKMINTQSGIAVVRVYDGSKWNLTK